MGMSIGETPPKEKSVDEYVDDLFGPETKSIVLGYKPKRDTSQKRRNKNMNRKLTGKFV